MARAKTRKPPPPPELEHSWPVLDRACRLAKALFKGVSAQVVLVGDQGVWRSHDPDGELPQDAPIADLAIRERRLIWIGDASQDPRLCDRPRVKGPPYGRLCVGAPIRLTDGSIPGILGVAGLEARPFDQDLADRLQDLADAVADEWARVLAERAREAALRASEAAQRMVGQIMGSLPIALVVTDREMRVLAASPRWVENWDLVGQEVIGRGLYDLTGMGESWAADHKRCLAGERISVKRVRRVKVDDSVIWLQAEAAPWRDASGAIGGLIIAAQNVTDMVAATERITHSEERLQLAMEIADLHVWELDYRRREIITQGVPPEIFFGEIKSFEELTSDPWSFIDPRDRADVHAAWVRNRETGEHRWPEYRIMRKDNKEVWVQGAVIYQEDENHLPLRAVGAIQDVTHRKLAEHSLQRAKEEAESATRAKSAVMAIVSHEIRTPLNGVLGMAQAMAMGDLSAQQRERVDVIRQAGESLLTILNDVLDLSKIEAGKLELEQAEFDIEETAAGALGAFSAAAQAKGLALTLKVQPSARGVYLGDSVRVRQILGNLVSNALKFTEEGGVRVSIGRRAGILRLKVTDSGMGASPEVLARLFQKFEQADASTTRRYGGTGLGLAICRDLAELMGGAIKAQSVPGEGATFTVDLPLPRVADARRTPQPSTAGSATDPAAGALRVLAAEDNGMNQLVLKTLLGQIGVEPVMVDNGREAVAAWARETWDLILMDVQMPDMDGPTASSVIRARERAEGRPRTPIVALTANAMTHQVAEYAQAGMDDFVAKPIEASRLYAVIQTALDRAVEAAAAAARRPKSA